MPHFPFQPAGRPDLVRDNDSWTTGTRGVDYAGMVESMDAGVGLRFNVAQDPGEQTDLSWKYPDRLAELQRLLADWEPDVTPKKPAPPQK